VQLDGEVEKTQIRIGYINVLTCDNRLIFGTYNKQPQKSGEVNKTVVSLFEKFVIQLLKEENALWIIIKHSWLVEGQKLEGSWINKESLTELHFKDMQGPIVASG